MALDSTTSSAHTTASGIDGSASQSPPTGPERCGCSDCFSATATLLKLQPSRKIPEEERRVGGRPSGGPVDVPGTTATGDRTTSRPYVSMPSTPASCGGQGSGLPAETSYPSRRRLPAVALTRSEKHSLRGAARSTVGRHSAVVCG